MSERRRYEPVTLGEIKELAEVGRPTVSNWRRRHESFPKPVGGSDSKPLFHTEEIARWLDERPVPDAEPRPDGTLPTYGERFRSGLRLRKLVALGHGERDVDDLLVRALAVAAMAGEGGGTVEERLYGGLPADLDRAGQQVEDIVDELIDEMGSAGAAADIVLGLAGRLESDLAMDETPGVVADLIAALAEPVVHGSEPRVVVNLCAGTGELLFAVGDVDALGEVVAVEPDPLRRRLLAYRLLAHWMAEGVELCAETAELSNIRPQAQQLRSGADPGEQPWGFPLADLVLADPPYASGEREDDEDGPLSWAMEAVRRLQPEGLGLVVVPAWTLSRPRVGKVTANVSMREDLFRTDAVVAIVQLPRRIHAFRTGAEHALLMLRGAPDGPRRPSKVLLIDADRLARRVGDKWPRHVVGLLHSGDTPMTEEAQRFHVAAPAPGLPSLLDGRSVLPAHRLVVPDKRLDHMAATTEAKQDAYAALPHLKQWIADLGIAERDPKAEHHNVGAQLRAGQLRLLPGHRIRESDIGEAGFPVIGREEMLGALAIGARRIMPEVLSSYPQARYTEAGDVLLLTEYGVHAHVDDAGGCVLLAPVQGLRITAYQAYKADLAKGKDVHPERLWMRPHPLAALLTAPRNQQRGSGSLVRRVSVRDMDLPQLAPPAVADLETVLVETERNRAEVRRQLAALDTLAERLAAGVADGDLLVRKKS